MKRKILSLIAFIILIAGLSALALLAGAINNNLVNFYQFLGLLGITATTLIVDAIWINNHFVDGEWV